MVFREPEVANVYGEVNDAAFVDGAPVSGHVLRELARNANRLKGRGDLAAQWNAHSLTGLDGVRSIARLFAAPYWQHLLPIPSLEVRKRAGVTSLDVHMQLEIESGFSVALFVGSTIRPTPRQVRSSDQTLVAGSASEQTVTISVPVRPGPTEFLSFYIRHLPNETTDPLMDTATFGAPNTGVIPNTVSRSLSSFRFPGATWTTAIPAGGHYVVFSSANGSQIRHVPSKIVSTYINSPVFELFFHPTIATNEVFSSLVNATFTLRELPSIRLISVGVYGARYTP